MLRWRAGDAHMHFGRASIAHHLHDLQAGGAADDRIVDQYDAFAVDQRLVGIVLELDAEVTDLVAGLAEGAPDILRAAVAEFDGNARFLRIADRRRGSLLGYGDDEIVLARVFAPPFRRSEGGR